MSSHIRRSVVLSLLGLVGSVGSTAGAQEVAAGASVTPGSPVSVFGNKGQIAISSEVGATFERTTVSGTDGSTTSFTLRPGVDYFLMKGLSLGVFGGVHHESVPAGSTTTFAVGPRVGYDFAFSDYFSLWPRAGVSFNSTKVEVDGVEVGGVETPSASTTNDAVAINLFAPLLFHTHRFFAGVGPALDTDLSGDAKATTFAVRVTLGGWVF
jgi:opacity protein-like surface antigen